MARAAVRLVFAAMLALLSTQAAVPSVRIVAAVETVWRIQSARAEAEQQAPRDVPRMQAVVRVRPSAPGYQSFVTPQPDIVLFFQLPPPAPSFAS